MIEYGSRAGKSIYSAYTQVINRKYIWILSFLAYTNNESHFSRTEAKAKGQAAKGSHSKTFDAMK